MEKRVKLPMKLLTFIMALLMLIVSLPTYALATLLKAETEQANETEEQSIEKQEIIVLEEEISLRDENIKQFKLSDGTTKAVVYSNAVHYKDAEGNWIDIDNALTLNGSEYSTSNKQSIKFANKSGSNGLVSIKDGDYKIDFTPLSPNKVSVEIENPQKNNSRKFESISVLNNLVSKATYKDIYDGIDIEYILVGNNIKENIIVKEKQDTYTFSFELKLNKLSAELVDGAIILSDCDSGEQVYEIPAPYMLDASNEYSESVEYTLTQESKWKYTLTVTADPDWLNAADRAFPVTIDPTVGVTNASLSDSTKFPNGDNFSNIPSVIVGDGYTSYISISKLPTLPKYAYLTNATISLKYDAGMGVYVGVYEKGSSSLCDYNYIVSHTVVEKNPDDPNGDPIVYEEYGDDGWFSWDISDVVNKWYNNGGETTELVFSAIDSTGIIEFDSKEYGAQSRPIFEISYRDMKGVEPYWSYISQSVGSAGNGSVNLATGNLTFEISTLTTTENMFGYTPSMIYSSALAGDEYKYGDTQNGYWYSFTANGFKLNMNETLIKKTYVNGSGETAFYYVWADADGTEHYFVKSTLENEENIYYDEDGLQLKLVVDLLDSSSKKYCKIVDSSHNERIFYILGGAPAAEGLEVYHLEQLKDKNGNILRFCFDGAHKPNDIKFTPNGTMQTTQLLGPLYNSKGKVALIWCNTTKEGVLFRHSDTPTGELNPTGGIYLREALYLKCDSNISWTNIINEFISDTDNEYEGITVNGVMKYEYDENGYLISAHDTLLDYKVEYIYSNGKVIRIVEYGKENTQGQTVGISYYSGYTEVRGSGSDDVYGNNDDIINVYVFDNEGRAVTVYSTNSQRTEIYGAKSGQYEDENENAKNSIKTSTVIGSTSTNYLLNGNFELVKESTPYWGIETNELGSVKYKNDGDIEWNNTKAQLIVDGSGQSAITQNVSLLPGEYTLSLDLNLASAQDAMISLKATALDASNEEYVEHVAIDKHIASGGDTFASLSFKVNGNYGVKRNFKLGIYVSCVNAPEIQTVQVDNVMLAKATGGQRYSWVSNGSFDQDYTSQAGNVGIWQEQPDYTSLVTNEPQFNKSLKIESSINKECVVEQVIYKCTEADIRTYENSYGANGSISDTETFVLSGFAKAPDAINSSKGKFALRVDITYHSTGNIEETVTERFFFNSACDDWQYVTGTFSTRKGGFISEIKVICEYSNNIGKAYFDNIRLEKDDEINPNTILCDYYKDGQLKYETKGWNTTYYIYNADGNIIDVLSDYQRTIYQYDTIYKNRVVKQLDYTHADRISSNGNFEEFYEKAKDVTDPLSVCLKSLELKTQTEYTYNQFGQVVEETFSDADSNQTVTTINTYENTVSSKIFGALLSTTSSVGTVSRYFYDSNNGRLISTIDTDGTGIYYTYDKIGNLVQVQPATYTSSRVTAVGDSSNVEYVYNSLNQLEKIIVYNSTEDSDTEAVCTEYILSYDVFGNQSSVAIGDSENQEASTIVSKTFNAYNGKISQVTYGRGGDLTTVAYEYDSLARVSKMSYTKGDKTVDYRYEYDSNGNLSKFIDGNNGTTTIYQYDLNGRLIKFIECDTEELTNIATTLYEYDSLESRLTHISHIQDYLYNLTTWGTIINSYRFRYNDDGSMKSIKIGVDDIYNYQIDFAYDDFNRIVEQITCCGDVEGNVGTNVKNIVTYKFLDASNIVTEYISKVNNTETTYAYTYDTGKENITEIRKANSILYRYTYDALDRLIKEENYALNKQYELTYDINGNILTMTEYDLLNGVIDTSVAPIIHNYEYSTGNWKDQLISYDGKTIEYDSLGNPTKYFDYNLVWENVNNLVTLSGGETNLFFTYNDEGIRTSKTVNGIKHTYILEGTKIVSESYGNNLIIYIYDENNAPIGLAYRNSSYAKNTFDKYLFTKNLQGDILNIYTEAGVKVASYTYDAWGNHTVTNYTSDNIGNINPFRYRGYYYDVETNFYYLNSRYYDPQVKRFISADSIDIIGATPDGLTDKNLYAYCDNNPVMRTDNGGDFWLTSVFIAAAVGAVMSAVSDMAVQLLTTGEIDIGQTLISAASGAISGACALIPGGVVVTTIASGAINAALNAGTYVVNQKRMGESIDPLDLGINAGIGAFSGVVGNLFRMNSTSAMRNSGNKLILKGETKISNGILNSSTSTIKRGFNYIDRGISMIRKYAVRAGTNSGFGSSVGNTLSGIYGKVMEWF